MAGAAAVAFPACDLQALPQIFLLCARPGKKAVNAHNRPLEMWAERRPGMLPATDWGPKCAAATATGGNLCFRIERD